MRRTCAVRVVGVVGDDSVGESGYPVNGGLQFNLI